MPRLQQEETTALQGLRAYAKENRGITSYDVAFWLTAAAFVADGKDAPSKPDYVRALSELEPKHKAEYDAALMALGLSGVA